MGARQAKPAEITEDTGVVESEPNLERRQEVLGILCLSASVLLALSLWSYDAQAAENWIGPVGRALAATLATAFGITAWLLPLEFGLASVRFFSRSRSLLGIATLASALVVVLLGCGVLHLALPGTAVFGGHLPGGVLGEVLGEVLRSLMGDIGAYVVSATIILVTLVLRLPISVTEMMLRAWRGLVALAHSALASSKKLIAAWREAKRIEAEKRAAELQEWEERVVEAEALSGDAEALTLVGSADNTIVDMEVAAEIPEEGADADDVPKEKAKAKATTKGASKGPRIIPPSDIVVSGRSKETKAKTLGSFLLPPSTLLERAPKAAVHIDANVLRDNANRLVEKLEAYGVRGDVDEIHPGPVVTLYEFEPKSGTKVSKIAGLADDLAMALAAQKVRIVAPIPGKARVGFELPNDVRQTVYLRTIVEDARWRDSNANLPIALGQDIAGRPVYCDLSRMPHLLVAGATGSGKSVGLNVMLVSLLMKKSPEEVRLLMIDPKVVELAVFDGIPHMLLPVVTDMQKASLALRWAVDEMERRYQLFADAGAKSIQTYNQRVQKVLDGTLSPEKLHKTKRPKPQDGPQDFESVEEPPPKPPEKLPYVVVVVDEFADLMMVAAKDVESAVARLAQKARAAGIHVILATQRPSVDVITGMIKANFPSRMAFKVSQREDSKTILGRNGAEHLLGMGDMLMLPPGTSELTRVHSAFVSEEEVKAVCDQLREQGDPVYDEDILKPREDDDSGAPGVKSDDPVYDRAVAVVAQAGYCSISHIQRQLSVGYNKAAKLVERMEKEGVVGPPSGKAGGRREVLVQAHT